MLWHYSIAYQQKLIKLNRRYTGVDHFPQKPALKAQPLAFPLLLVVWEHSYDACFAHQPGTVLLGWMVQTLVCLSVRLLPLSRPSAFLILLRAVGKIISRGAGEAEVLCMVFCLSSCICVNLFADSSLTLNFVTVHLSRCKRGEM